MSARTRINTLAAWIIDSQSIGPAVARHAEPAPMPLLLLGLNYKFSHLQV